MAFKNGSTEMMNQLASELQGMSNDVSTHFNKTLESIEFIKQNVSGMEIATPMATFSQNIDVMGKDIVRIFSEASAFINRQNQSLAENEKEAASDLNNIAAEIDNLDV